MVARMVNHYITLHYITLHYITLHYITMVLCKLHCMYVNALVRVNVSIFND